MKNNIERTVREYTVICPKGTVVATLSEPYKVVAEDAFDLYIQSEWQPNLGAIRKINKEEGNPIFADGEPLV